MEHLVSAYGPRSQLIGTGSLAVRGLEELQRQARLADTGLAGDEHHMAEPGERRVQGPGQLAQRLLSANDGRLAHGSIIAGPDLAGREFQTRASRVRQSPTRKVKHMILSAYQFEGDPEGLMDCHRRMMQLFPPTGLDLHIAVTNQRGLTVYDSCPDLATHQAFVASPEFAGALAEVGLPKPMVTVLGEVHFAHLNQSALR